MPKKKASLVSKQKSISDARKVRIPALICADFFRARAQPQCQRVGRSIEPGLGYADAIVKTPGNEGLC